MDFDEIIDRKGTYCTQWDYIEDRFGEGSKDVTPFTISDMDFRSPQEITAKIIERANHGVFGYSRWNHKDYKGAIKNWFLNRYQTNIETDWVVYSPSVLYSITLLLEKLAKKTKRVMTHTPRYDGFTKLLSLYELVQVELKERKLGEYCTDFNKIEKEFKKGIDVFLLCNPQNPTGKVWEKEELKILVKLCIKYSVYLISDEIHMDICNKVPTSVLKLDKLRSIVVSSPSKTFNIPTLGGSYVVIPQDKIKQLFLDHLRNIDGVSTAAIMGVIGTITAYNECAYWVDELNKYIKRNLELVKKELNGYMGIKVYIPDASYLMWIDFSETGLTGEEFQKHLLKKGKVAIMSGLFYGDENKIRLNIGCSIKKVEIGIEGIKKALKE